MELNGRPALLEVVVPRNADIAHNIASLEKACVVVIDRRATHRAIALMFKRFLLVDEPIQVADLAWKHKAYLVTFPSVDHARTVVESGPTSFEGFRFYSEPWSPEWCAGSMDAHLAVWIDVGKFPTNISIRTRRASASRNLDTSFSLVKAS